MSRPPADKVFGFYLLDWGRRFQAVPWWNVWRKHKLRRELTAFHGVYRLAIEYYERVDRAV